MHSKLNESKKKDDTPGPGQYQIFSEFGQVEEEEKK